MPGNVWRNVFEGVSWVVGEEEEKNHTEVFSKEESRGRIAVIGHPVLSVRPPFRAASQRQRTRSSPGGWPKERRRITRRHPGDALLFIIIRYSILPSLLQLHHAPRWALRTEHLVVNDGGGEYPNNNSASDLSGVSP